MSKYKLIKEYPMSPSLGTIVTKQAGVYAQIDGKGVNRRLTDIENYPEFWEEVVEEEYEILAFKNSSYYYTKSSDGLYRSRSCANELGFKLENMLNLPIPIYSVKRLSDGEV